MSDEPKKYIPISQVSDIFLMAWRENGDLTHAEYEAEMKRRYPPSFIDGWQPIETAPKYGLLLVANFSVGDEWPDFVRVAQGFGTSKDHSIYSEYTHWMPLPEAPKEQENK